MDWTPDRIRALRGDRTRAELAAALGVAPLTIYRWELPDEANESRRPRRRSRDRLDALAAAEGVTGDAAPTETWQPDRAILHLLAAGRWSDAEGRALEALATGTARTPGDRAFLQACVAKIQLMCRNDVRGALSTMAPVLATVTELPGPVQALVHATAALLYATPDGHLFDAGRAAGHAARVPAEAEPNVRAMSVVAAARAAWHLGDAAAFTRRIEAERLALAGGIDPAVRVLVDEVLALHAELSGRPTEAVRRLHAVADRAGPLGMAPVAARCLGRAGFLRLMNAECPDKVLPQLDRAEALCREARATPGDADLEILGAHAEALFRQARYDEAAATVERAEQLARASDWPALTLTLCRSRLDFHRGGAEAARATAGAFEAAWGQRSVPAFEATSRFLEGVAAMCEGDLATAAPQLRDAFRAGEAVGTLPTQTQLACLLCVGCWAYLGDQTQARSTLGILDRAIERHPSPWLDLLASHARGMLASLEGRAIEALRTLEAAADSLDRAGDVGEAARLRRAGAIAAWVLGEPDAQQRLDATEAECAALGIALAPIQQRDRVRRDLVDRKGMAEASLGLVPANLVVPFRRIATRGFEPTALVAEIRASAARFLGDPDLTLTPISDGGGRPEGASVVIGDGFGGRWRLAASGPADPGKQAALELLGATAGLALELATLRAGGPPLSTRDRLPDLPEMVAESPAMRRLIGDLRNVARSRSTILVHGESGSGKEVVATAVHQLSPRSEAPYITFNSAAVPRELFEGELFGYRKGAFTGATRDHIGVIRAADGGTLFLDEIGDMPLDVQAKLLRFLENGEVLPLGESRPVVVDVRVVAATHRDLEQMVADRRFREDLYYRLQVVVVRVPALRERTEDVLPLARHFIDRLSEGPGPILAADALVTLNEHPWPGNVRELRNVIERALAYQPGATVLDRHMLRLGSSPGRPLP